MNRELRSDDADRVSLLTRGRGGFGLGFNGICLAAGPGIYIHIYTTDVKPKFAIKRTYSSNINYGRGIIHR